MVLKLNEAIAIYITMAEKHIIHLFEASLQQNEWVIIMRFSDKAMTKPAI